MRDGNPLWLKAQNGFDVDVTYGIASVQSWGPKDSLGLGGTRSWSGQAGCRRREQRSAWLRVAAAWELEGSQPSEGQELGFLPASTW